MWLKIEACWNKGLFRMAQIRQLYMYKRKPKKKAGEYQRDTWFYVS